MSDFKFNCPHCQQSLEAPKDILGTVIECPSCNGSIQLPAPQPQTPQVVPSMPRIQPQTQKKLVLKRDKPATLERASSTRACPFCGEEILAVAIKCKHCGSDLNDSGKEQTGTNTLSAVMIVLLIILGMFWLAIGLLQTYLSFASPRQFPDSWIYGILNVAISIWNLSLIVSIVKRKKSVVGSLLFLGIAGSLFGVAQLLFLDAWLQIIPVPLYIILAILAVANKEYFRK
jgi:ribosomal protein L37AE/L43A